MSWTGLESSESWSETERTWVLIEDHTTKLASCFVYLRVESTKNSTNFANNSTLLDTISLEITHLQARGFKIIIQGDFNAHISQCDNFAFINYPHPANNNGSLVMDFAAKNHLFCLNPMKWGEIQAEEFTFQRDVGSRVIRSIIDFGLGSLDAIDVTSSFTIHDDSTHAAESDHSSLVWTFRLTPCVASSLRPKNPLRSIKNWKIFKEVLEKRLLPTVDCFRRMPSAVQGSFLSNEMRTVGMSVSPGPNENLVSRCLVSPRMRSLLNRKKMLRAKLKSLSSLKASNTSELRQHIQNCSLSIRKQFYVESLRQKKKMRSLLCGKGPEAQKLYWSLVNPKPLSSVGIDALEKVDDSYVQFFWCPSFLKTLFDFAFCYLIIYFHNSTYSPLPSLLYLCFDFTYCYFIIYSHISTYPTLPRPYFVRIFIFASPTWTPSTSRSKLYIFQGVNYTYFKE